MRLIDVEGGANVGMLLLQSLQSAGALQRARHAEVPTTFKLTHGQLPVFRHGADLLLDRAEDSVGWHDTVCGNTTKRRRGRWGAQSYRTHRNEWTQNGHEASWSRAASTGSGGATSRPTSTGSARRRSAMTVPQLRSRQLPAPGDHVELRFEMDTLVLLHTCPHPLESAPRTYPRKPVASSTAIAARRGRAVPRTENSPRLREHRLYTDVDSLNTELDREP